MTGRLWSPGCNGGRDYFLGELDCPIFQAQALEHCRELECLTTRDAIALAATIKTERLRRAREIMRICRLSLHAHLEGEAQPCRSWVLQAAEICGLRIAPPQYIEAARRWFCNFDAIANFFLTFKPLFHRDPRLIFNADETMVSGMKRFRVLAEMGKLPLVKAETKLPHLTAMCAISASGIAFKPFIVLPNLKGLKKLAEIPDVHFATSLTGWMNRNVFLAWTICFCSELSVYRLTLPEGIRDEPVLLILDGHNSRVNLTALMILDLFNVDVLCLPAHSTHVVQPIDVAVAAPLKTYFKQEFAERIHELLAVDPTKREKSDTLRYLICTAFIDAYRKATTRSNCAAGFGKSGMAPFNPAVPLSSQFVMEVEIAEPDLPRRETISSMILTGEEGLAAIARLQYGRDLAPEDQETLNIVETSPFPAVFRERGTRERGTVTCFYRWRNFHLTFDHLPRGGD
jgi:hypothetical protein